MCCLRLDYFDDHASLSRSRAAQHSVPMSKLLTSVPRSKLFEVFIVCYKSTYQVWKNSVFNLINLIKRAHCLIIITHVALSPVISKNAEVDVQISSYIRYAIFHSLCAYNFIVCYILITGVINLSLHNSVIFAHFAINVWLYTRRCAWHSVVLSARATI